jgi:hypothetical protein
LGCTWVLLDLEKKKKEKRKQNNDKHVKNINPEDITPHHTKNCLVYLGGRSFPIKNARLARDGRGLTIPVGLLPLLPRPHLFFLFCLSLPSPLPLPLLPTPWPVFSNKTTTTTMSVRPTTTMNTNPQTPPPPSAHHYKTTLCLVAHLGFVHRRLLLRRRGWWCVRFLLAQVRQRHGIDQFKDGGKT